MKTIQSLIAVACLLFSNVVISQQEYDIRFTVKETMCEENQICYYTQIRSADGQSWNLAGQNYRIYYDASMASYVNGSAKRADSLDPNQYSDILLTADIQDRDASAFPGDLSFKSTLSFLNYSVDLMNLTNGGIDLPANGDWVSTTELCFDITDELRESGSECLGLVWARMGKTDGIATAFVEISEWERANTTTEAAGREYDDLDAEDGDESCVTRLCDPDGPDNEVTDANCSDGEDNDEDGLIDCADPGCASTMSCEEMPNLFDLSLTQSSLDCSTGMVCYNVNLLSADDSTFVLAGQRYQLYYNSGVGSFVSGISQLGNEFQSLSLQASTPIENINAPGVGDLPFEDDLGFINFIIQLSDEDVGSSVIISSDTTRVAELCWVMTDAAIVDPNVCFETTWAREGVTNAYNASMVGIDEWIGPGSTMSTLGSSYGDLTAASGAACFVMSCVIDETGDVECSDGMDNDDDGLIDCLDPNCVTTNICIDGCDALAPDLGGGSNANTSCDFTTGTVVLSSSGGNTTDLYTTSYVLTSSDGDIISINTDEASFNVLAQGFYVAYSVNFKVGSTINGLAVDGNISNLVGDCFDVGQAQGLTVCEELSLCDYCLGEAVTLTPGTGNTEAGFTNKYVLVDDQGIIVSVVDNPEWMNLEEGIYTALLISFATDPGLVGLEVGLNFNDLDVTSFNEEESRVIGVCDQLNPTIFFDLKGCDITETAVLVVSEFFDSYEWSTGSTNDFIEVSATEPATYSVTVTLSNGCIGIKRQDITGEEITELGDFVWEDSNANGRQDDDESGLNGVTVNLYADFDKNGRPDFPDPSCTTTTSNHPETGEPGWYLFNVYRANFVMEFVAPTGYVTTTQNEGDDLGDSDIDDAGFTGTIDVEPNSVVVDIDAGFRTSTGIGGVVWVDADGDGRRERDELGINDITVSLYTAAGDLVSTTITLTDPVSGIDGSYCFDNIPVSEYYVEIMLPSGRTLSPGNIGTDDTVDSDAIGTNGFGTTGDIETNPGVKTNDVDFGIYTGGVVCGLVWRDVTPGTENVYDEGTDSLIAGSQILIVDSNTGFNVRFGETGEDGRYCIDAIPVGSYVVSFRAHLSGEAYVQVNQGDDPLLDSDVNNTFLTTEAFFLMPEDSLVGINAGLRMDALPIELLSFEGAWNDQTSSVDLTWSTASEINNDHFEIERIIDDAVNFTVIGQEAGNGTTTTQSDYSFSDSEINRSGTYYYRLKQVDYDGGYEYSDVISIDVALTAQPTLNIYPNPVADKVQINLNVDKRDFVTVTFTDLLGRQVRKIQSQRLESGQNLLNLDISDLTAGSYMVTVQIGSSNQHKIIQVTE